MLQVVLETITVLEVTYMTAEKKYVLNYTEAFTHTRTTHVQSD